MEISSANRPDRGQSDYIMYDLPLSIRQHKLTVRRVRSVATLRTDAALTSFSAAAAAAAAVVTSSGNRLVTAVARNMQLFSNSDEG